MKWPIRLLLLQPLTGLAQSSARGRHFMLFAWRVPSVMAGDKPLTALFHQPSAFGLGAARVIGCISWRAIYRFVFRDEVLQSMLPWRRNNHSGRCAEFYFRG